MRSTHIAEPIPTVVDVANQFIGCKESGGSNRGPQVDFFNWWIIRDPKWWKGRAWCSTFINTVGRLALGVAWPIPVHPSYSDVDKMVAWAQAKRVWHDTPEYGDLFAVRGSGGDWVHIGLVTWIDSSGFIQTIEGNTNQKGSREGTHVMKRKRAQSIDIGYIRWADMLS